MSSFLSAAFGYTSSEIIGKLKSKKTCTFSIFQRIRFSGKKCFACSLFRVKIPMSQGGWKMEKKAENYLTGKKGESQTWEYLLSVGFVRPSEKQRNNIVAVFAEKGIKIEKRAFDAVSAEFSDSLDSLVQLESNFNRLVLYEVKTCGLNRNAKVTEGFQGFGFTLTKGKT